MVDLARLDEGFHIIISRMVETGQAPHYAELATAMGCSIEEGRRTLYGLIEAGYPICLHTGTDYIASFAPLSSVPNQYCVSVEGMQKWFGQ